LRSEISKARKAAKRVTAKHRIRGEAATNGRDHGWTQMNTDPEREKTEETESPPKGFAENSRTKDGKRYKDCQRGVKS
jgi:hypothetical protein